MMVAFRAPISDFNAAVVEVAGLTQKEIVHVAKREHALIMRTPPKPLGFRRRVDGREAPEEDVKVGGVIVYDYNRLVSVAYLAWDVLREMSPVGTGDDPHPGFYRNSHKFVVGGRVVLNFRDLKGNEEIIITNTVEYSRVIELGTRGGVKLKINKGAHVYERAAARLRSYPDVANAAKVFFDSRIPALVIRPL